MATVADNTRVRLLDPPGAPEIAPSTDAEHQTARALLGAVLLNVGYAWPCAKDVPIQHWPVGFERTVARAMHRLDDQGLVIDVVTIAGEIQAMGEEVSFTSLSELTGATPTSCGAPTYAAQLNELAGRRILAGVLDQATRRLLQPGADVAAVVASVSEALEPQAWADTNSGLRVVDGETWQETAGLPREDVFTDLLPAGIVAGISADAGRGKTFLAIEMAVAAATGRHLAPFRPVSKMNVLLLCGEDSWRVISRRLKSIAAAFNIPPDELTEALRERLRVVEAPAAPLVRRDRDANLDTTPAYGWIAAQIRRYKPSLVILDPLSQWYGLGENDAVESTYFVNRLKAAVGTSNASVVVLHHFGKSGETRGSTGFKAAFRWHAGMLPMDEDEAKKYGIRFDDARRYVKLEIDKLNDGEIPAPIWFERVAGGVLRQSDLRTERLSTLAGHISAFLEKRSLSLTEREILKDEAGSELRKYIREEVPGAVTADIEAAISHGSRSGILDTNTVRRGKNSVIEVSAPCPF